MAIRGTKKTVEALELLFETGKKPKQQDFFDWMASFYHKDEDISFLINIAKATLTDAQTGSDNSRFMTALRVYQSILWWVRIDKLPLLSLDVSEMINDAINNMWSQLLATNDGDNVIDTLGEVFQAFQDFSEQIGTIKNFSDRIGAMETVLHQVPGNLRQVQNTFDSLQNQVYNAQARADDAWTRANNAQGTANDAVGLANNAQSSANNAQARADDAWTRANNAQGSADSAYGLANDAHSKLGAFGYNSQNAYNQHNALQNYTYTAIGYIQTKLSEVFAHVGLPAPY